MLMPKVPAGGAEPREIVARADLVLVDLDGCLAFGGVPHPDAERFLRAIDGRYVVLSNNSSTTPDALARDLAGYGLVLDPHRILLAGSAMIEMLAEESEAKFVQLIASEEIVAYARAMGLRLIEAGGDIVALARDTGLTYAKLARAVAALAAGAKLVVSNPDLTHPGMGRVPVPETGALLAALRACLPDIEPRIVGKPAPILFRRALARFGVDAAQAVMIGDNAATDGEGARGMGMNALLVGPGHALAGIGDLVA